MARFLTITVSSGYFPRNIQTIYSKLLRKKYREGR